MRLSKRFVLMVTLCMLAVTLGLTSFVVWRVATGFSKPMKDFLTELTPGMTVDEVEALMPSKMLSGDGCTSETMASTTLNPQDAQVKAFLKYYNNPPDWRLLGKMELCYLYFDARDHLVGMYYTSSYYQFEASQLSQWRDLKR